VLQSQTCESGRQTMTLLPKKKKKQTSENMAMRFFADSHLLTRIFAHSCIRCEASAFGFNRCPSK
jgi:hypothetical protein